MDETRFAIVGCGMVAGYAAKQMVDLGLKSGELAILSADTSIPYERPPLSKGFLAGRDSEESIRINAVTPNAFPTAATAIHADQEALWRGVLEAQSLKRRGEVEDVARAIAFFAGEDSRFVTGQTLLVDGGWMRG